MTTFLAIDPGARSGFSMWFLAPDCAPMLAECWAAGPDNGNLTLMPDVVVIESPQIYPNSPARPNDILTLARIVGRYQERFAGIKQRLVTPHEWKGSINGDIFVARIKAALTPHEALLASKGDNDHNMLDAIGLAKWCFRQPWMRGATGLSSAG